MVKFLAKYKKPSLISDSWLNGLDIEYTQPIFLFFLFSFKTENSILYFSYK